jgi:hypothetical protein
MARKKSPTGRAARAVVNSLFESLETRTLFSTLNIASYGAVPNDGRDDTSAIVAALRASSDGDTILIPTGSFQVSSMIDPRGGGRTITGQSGAILKQTTQSFVFHVTGSNLTIRNISFQGRGVFIDSPSGMNANITIDNNSFDLTGVSGEKSCAVEFTSGLRNSKITNNTFTNITDTGVYGYYWDSLTIANNEFNGGNEGIHVIDFGNSSKNLLMEQNHFQSLHRMGIEYQGGGQNTIVQDNYYEKPVMTSNFADNNSTFAYSIIADQSVGTIIRRNTSIAPERPDGVGVRIIFEVGGDNTLVEDNYSSGGNHVLAANDMNGTTSIMVRNNRWTGYLQGPAGRGMTLINNGPNVALTWDINRGIPGPNRRLTSTGWSTEGLPPAPDPTPTPTPTPTPSTGGSTYLSDLNWSSAVNGWGPVEKDRSNGEALAGDGKTLTLNGKTYAKGLGVHANSEIHYQLNGQYASFNSDIGIDDEVASSGNVTFSVWADGQKLYDSGAMTGVSATKSVNVDLTGKQELVLKVDGGVNINFDHADWAGAQVVTAGGTVDPTPAPTPTPAAQIYLSDLGVLSQTNSWGPMEKDRSNGEAVAGDGRTITLNGVTYAKGLGVHADSKLVYSLNGQYSSFTTDMGVDDEVGTNGSVVFQIWTDGTKVYDSGTMTGSSATKTATADVSGKNQLWLVVTTAGNGNNFDHADWAGARLSTPQLV